MSTFLVILFKLQHIMLSRGEKMEFNNGWLECKVLKREGSYCFLEVYNTMNKKTRYIKAVVIMLEENNGYWLEEEVLDVF